MDKSIADLIELIISDWKRFASFCLLVGVLAGLSLTMIWLVPQILHLTASKLIYSRKEGARIEFTSLKNNRIELKSSTKDSDQYYLVVSPQTTWQPTHVHVKKGDKLTILADGRVNIDFHGLFDQTDKRNKLEKEQVRRHPNLRKDPNHTPEQYYSPKEWKTLVLSHYWTGPDGQGPSDTAFVGRMKYKIAPDLGFGTLIGAIVSCDVGKNGQPPIEQHDVFRVGSQWPDPNTDDLAPAAGCLWLTINDVVLPESAVPNARGVDGLSIPDLFFLDNLGFYRVVVTVPHSTQGE